VIPATLVGTLAKRAKTRCYIAKAEAIERTTSQIAHHSPSANVTRSQNFAAGGAEASLLGFAARAGSCPEA